MIYLLTTLPFLLGVGWHIMQIVMKLRKKFPQFGFRMIFVTFFQQEWDSLIRSGLMWATLMMWIFISRTTHIHLPPWYDKWGVYVIALLAGYAGQRLAYRYLSTAEEVLERKADLISKQ